jgi:peptide chain release factor 2
VSAISGGGFDEARLQRELTDLEAQAAAPDFWKDQANAQKVMQRRRRLEEDKTLAESLRRQTDDLLVLFDWAKQGEDVSADLTRGLPQYERDVDAAEIRMMLSGELDRNNAIITIHPGAGGTESQDWAEMLMRMYQRWAERHGYKVTMLDFQAGDEAGIKDAVLEIEGEYAYGYLRSENGVHRLVRISPYDANQRRHTSFSSVQVTPAVDDTITVDVNPVDLRVDTFRASGAGGQHVNKTESAVRITHLPTGLVVQSQAERSQHRNREMAMRILMSRLYVHIQEQERVKTEAAREPKKDIDFGSQIRSYVLQPYTMANDHRTELKIPDVHRVLDGDLDAFIDAYLKQKGKS